MSVESPHRVAAISAGLIAARLDESARSLVEFYLDRDEEGWRECCGSHCSPCISQVAQAVDVARHLLSRGDES